MDDVRSSITERIQSLRMRVCADGGLPGFDAFFRTRIEDFILRCRNFPIFVRPFSRPVLARAMTGLASIFIPVSLNVATTADLPIDKQLFQNADADLHRRRLLHERVNLVRLNLVALRQLDIHQPQDD